MHSLKKLGAIGGAILLVACWPLAVGQIAQKVIEDGIGNLSNSSVKAEIVQYNRSYFSANAVTRYTIIDPHLAKNFETDGLPTFIEVNHDINHGLVGIDARSYVNEPSFFQFELNTQTELNGDTRFDLVGNKFNFTDSKGSDLIVEPYTVKGAAAIAGEIEAKISLPRMIVNSSDGHQLLLEGFQIQAVGENDDGLWVGRQDIELGLFQLTRLEGKIEFLIENLLYTLKTNKNEIGDKFASLQTLLIKSLVAEGYQAKNVELDFVLNGINSKALHQLISIYRDGGVVTQERMNQALPLLDQVVETGFVFELNKFFMNLDGGDFESMWKFTVPSGQKDVSKNASVLLNVVEGRLDTFISNELLQSYPFLKENVDELLIMEFATENDKGVDMNAELINGQVKFDSGKQLPLLAIFLPIMSGR